MALVSVIWCVRVLAREYRAGQHDVCEFMGHLLGAVTACEIASGKFLSEAAVADASGNCRLTPCDQLFSFVIEENLTCRECGSTRSMLRKESMLKLIVEKEVPDGVRIEDLYLRGCRAETALA